MISAKILFWTANKKKKEEKPLKNKNFPLAHTVRKEWKEEKKM